MPKGVPNKRYTPEFKRMVVETMKKGHLSIVMLVIPFLTVGVYKNRKYLKNHNIPEA